MSTTAKKYRNFMAVISADKVQDISQLVALCKPLSAQWCVIHHDKDNASDHYHIALAYDGPRTIDAVANSLKMASNFVQKWDERKNNLWSYLTHTTDNARAEKYHYDDYLKDKTKCVANFDIAKTIKSATKASNNKNAELNRVVQQLLTGELSGRDLLKPEYIFFYWENKNKLDQAISLRVQSLQFNPPDCETLLITGASGCGKTREADRLARSLYGESVCWASSANDPLQDYQGEACIIFDDWRPQDYDWNTMLALLDPHYRQRSHASRYYNKPLAVKYIILTTVLSIDEIIDYYDRQNDEDKKQLRRRIQTIMDKSKKICYEYSEIMDTYIETDNPFIP